MLIRHLVPSDAAAFQALRLAALRECPCAFSSSHEEECGTPLDIIEGHLTPGSGRNMFGAFVGSDLVGTVGVGREGRRKLKHKGFIRGMYVAAVHRGQGLGRRLLEHALVFAASIEGLHKVTLTVTAGNAAAVALYESMGFQVFGHERGALLVDGLLYDEMQMMFTLEANSGVLKM